MFVGCAETPVERPPNTGAAPATTSAPDKAATGSADKAAKPAAASKYPASAKKPVVNEYHGTKVTDDYQWLEDPKAPEVKAWIDEQTKAARAHLDALPGRDALKARIRGIMSAVSGATYDIQKAGKLLLAVRFQPPKQQGFLIALTSPNDEKPRVLVDPNEMDPKARTTIDWFEVSPDNKLVAVSMSEGGTENGSVHLWEIESGKKLADVVPFAHSGTAGGTLAWAGDSKGFYYTRHPHTGERPAEDMGFYQQTYFHKVGTKDSEDKYELGKDFPKIAEIFLKASPDGKWTLATVQNGDGGEYWQYLRDAKGKWTKFADLGDKAVEATFGPDNKLYVRSLKDAPRGKVLRLSPDKPDLSKADVVVAQGQGVVEKVIPAKSRVYVVELAGGPSVLRAYDLKGKALGDVPTLPISAVRQVVRVDGDDLLFQNTSYTEPMGWYTYAAKGGKVDKTKLRVTSPVNFEDIEVTRAMCSSKDGTKVPVNILRKKGSPPDGSAPAMLIGYGGYGNSLSPGASPLNRVWFDQGGVLAIANLRGGGEYGEPWHLAGNLLNKQNVFDDFYACAKYLVDMKYTSSARLAIRGGSNGGLLMGAALTQHPEMYKAVVSAVGIYDMLRVELTTNGQFNTTEFGSVKDPAQFKALYAYSPLHNVKDGTAYPAVLFTTGANDPRVDAYHSRKMTARLQAATSGGVVVLRADDKTGHGSGTPLDDIIDREADVLSFLFGELGITFNPGK